MKTIALATALTAALAAPAAFASDSLARSLNVESGVYTTAELIQLRRAIEDQDQTYVDFILNGGGNPTSASVAFDARLRQAIEDEDRVYEAFLRNGGTESISTQSFGAPNHVAIAQALLAQPHYEDDN